MKYLFILVSYLAAITANAAPLYYDEVIDGDLGYNTYGSREVLQLDVGTNTIRGTSYGFDTFSDDSSFETRIAGAGDDFIFQIQDSHVVTDILVTIEDITPDSPKDQSYFLGWYIFNKVKDAYEYDINLELQHYYDLDTRIGDVFHYSNLSEPLDIFSTLNINNPLESGTYQLDYSGGGSIVIYNYEYAITVAAVPLPASVFLMLSGCTFLFGFRKLISTSKVRG
jgi:hypothetical protein